MMVVAHFSALKIGVICDTKTKLYTKENKGI